MIDFISNKKILVNIFKKYKVIKIRRSIKQKKETHRKPWKAARHKFYS